MLWVPDVVGLSYGLAFKIVGHPDTWQGPSVFKMLIVVLIPAFSFALLFALPVVVVIALWSKLSDLHKHAQVRKLLQDQQYREAMVILRRDSFQRAVAYLQDRGVAREQAQTSLRLLREYAEKVPDRQGVLDRVDAEFGGLFDVARAANVAGIGGIAGWAEAIDEGADQLSPNDAKKGKRA